MARYSKSLFVSLLVIVGVFIIIGVVLIFSGEEDQAEVSVLDFREDDIVYGNSESDVWVIEYSDFQCPACGVLSVVMKKVREESGEDIGFVHRNFPLSYHPMAYLAAEAVEAAGVQGKYIEMHDLIFSNQQNISEETIMGYAESLDINMAKFEDDFLNHKFTDQVDRDIDSGKEAGVNATPTLYINGEKFEQLMFDGKDVKRILDEINSQ